MSDIASGKPGRKRDTIDPSELSFGHGAFWIDPEGRQFTVPGFHEEWIHEHPELVGGCENVCDVVTKLGWISFTGYSGGYVEFFVQSRNPGPDIEFIRRFLSLNEGKWKTAVIISMENDGAAIVSPEDAIDSSRFEAAIASSSE